VVQAVLTGRLTGLGFDLAWFSYVLQASLYLYSLYIFKSFCYLKVSVTFLFYSLKSWAGWDCP